MDADMGSPDQAGHPAPTALAKQVGIAHVCDHRCSVQHLFGNAYRCGASGQVHICDANCTQRVYNDRYSSVCRVSRRVFATLAPEPAPCRKRAGGDDAADAFRKRGPAAATGQEGAYYSQGPSQEDAAMVM